MNIDSLCPRDDLQAQWKVKACSKRRAKDAGEYMWRKG